MGGLGYPQSETPGKLGVSQSQVRYRLSKVGERAEDEGRTDVLGSPGLYCEAEPGEGPGERIVTLFGSLGEAGGAIDAGHRSEASVVLERARSELEGALAEVERRAEERSNAER